MNALHAPTMALSANSRQWLKALMISMFVFAVAAVLMHGNVWATDGDEFAGAATKFETWIKGNLGKLSALVALCIGAVVAGLRKDWSWLGGAVILSMGIGVIIGIINSSFTAVI